MISIVALTECLGRPVVDPEGARVGVLQDLAVLPLEHPTRVGYLVVRAGGEDRVISAQALSSIGGGSPRLRSEASGLRSLPTENLLLLKRDLLDQQIIDG